LDADYHGTELSRNRQVAEKIHADRLAVLLKTVPKPHDLGSSRYDDCVGGQWFDEDSYYMPYVCRTTSTTLLGFGGDFHVGAAKLVAAAEATGCGAEGIRESLEESMPIPDGDVSRLDDSGALPCELPGPLEDSRVWIRWSPADPNEEQRERSLTQVKISCVGTAFCEADPLNVDDVLRKMPAGDKWIAAVTSQTTYWRGEPIS
jgi:hypothetical protein